MGASPSLLHSKADIIQPLGREPYSVRHLVLADRTATLTKIDRFSNQYFKLLLNRKWTPRQWDGPFQYVRLYDQTT